MTAFTRRATSAQQSDKDPADWGIVPGDRLDAHRSRRRRKIVRRGILVLSAIGAGWALYDDPSRGARWWSGVTATLAPAYEWAMSGPPAPSPAVVPPLGPLTNLDRAPPSAAVQAPMPAPPATEPSEAAALIAPAEQPVGSPVTTATRPVAEPYAPPQPLATDPLQKRAEAVGLHPDLSRVLLSQLSETDFRNAAVAIRTALAETADDAVFLWPRQGKAGLAIFQVHFVPGAGADCRRYVVTVARDGWRTTALPVEKCGVRRGEPKRS